MTDHPSEGILIALVFLTGMFLLVLGYVGVRSRNHPLRHPKTPNDANLLFGLMVLGGLCFLAVSVGWRFFR